MKKYMLVLCSVVLLQGCENPDDFLYGALAVGGLVALAGALSDDCRPAGLAILPNGGTAWDVGTC